MYGIYISASINGFLQIRREKKKIKNEHFLVLIYPSKIYFSGKRLFLFVCLEKLVEYQTGQLVYY